MLGTVEPTSFCYRDEVVQLLTDRAASLPVHTDTPVVDLDHDGSRFVVRTPDEAIRAETVVLANGLQNVRELPAQANRVPPVCSRSTPATTGARRSCPTGRCWSSAAHSRAARSPRTWLARDGASICRPAAWAAMPWHYRGRELLGWLVDCGFWDQRPEDLPSPADARLPNPLVASGGRSLDLRILAGLGVTLLGRFEPRDGERVTFAGSPGDNVAYAD